MTKKWVYNFAEGSQSMKDILGGKGCGLAEMTRIGLPVPPGFVITTEVCEYYYANGNKYPADLNTQVEKYLAELEKTMGHKLGDKSHPLLVSVRSGAAISMPGMMDTILNLGLNDASVEGIISQTKNERFALDCYRRFIQMFSEIAMGIDHNEFEHLITETKKIRGIKLDYELSVDELKSLIAKYKALYKKMKNEDFPQDSHKQLWAAISAVFGSWENDRAKIYRKLNNIRGLKGTAVTVQTMVFGNMGDDCATGVAFTRNPATGENKFYGEFLPNAQGEDVVAGIRTPKPIEELGKLLPEAYKQLLNVREILEKHYKDMQDTEFTIQEKKLYMLQTRSGKRTAQAAVRAAVEMVGEGLIDEKTGVMRVDPYQLDQLLHKNIDPAGKKSAHLLGKGLPASPGAAVGQVVFTAELALKWKEDGKKVVLVRKETSPEDIEGMNAATGILTATGGMTSHAAVVARGMGKCCVSGCMALYVKDEKAGIAEIAGTTIKEGDWITLDGSTGEIFLGQLPTVDPELSGNFGTLMAWASKYKKLVIKTNADIPRDAEVAKRFGAEGIGLCRTEHMFFEPKRILTMRKMILADNLEDRKKYLEELLPYQKDDFKGLFKIMNGLPCIIRLLDPPLHEFLPQEPKQQKEVADQMGITVDKLQQAVVALHEFNPMLGFRGCRLGVKYPEINHMQCRAIFMAALECIAEGLKPMPYIEVPLVGHVKELRLIKELMLDALKVTHAEGKVNYKFGTMIEVPRGALTADELAAESDFFSFGTNDLTQMTCGFSRDDVAKFIKYYVDKNIYPKDPFMSIDQDGVGLLMRLCVEKGRKVNPHLEIGICGEHGGDPDSVAFCHKIGLNDVSCSPYRVPLARLAAAQAAIKDEMNKKH
ncbi:MAG: pyruvate, phosphate dikinase [Acidobacteriaceae bacterium]|nr:pyruvate, phosphate dikinase [Acidobacteriaceae bacterium]